MKKVVLKLEVHNEKGKQKAMKAVSSLPGISSITVELKEKKMTVVGDVDPIDVVEKLRKLAFAEILTVGPPKEESEKTTQTNIAVNPCYPPCYYVQTVEENPYTCVIC